MTRRGRLWLWAADLFTLTNVGGAVFAASRGELLHAMTHVALAVVTAYVVMRLGQAARHGERAGVSPGTDRLDHLQQSIDAVALEVERIGEAQRFNAKLQAERIEKAR